MYVCAQLFYAKKNLQRGGAGIFSFVDLAIFKPVFPFLAFGFCFQQKFSHLVFQIWFQAFHLVSSFSSLFSHSQSCDSLSYAEDFSNSFVLSDDLRRG